MMCKMCLCAVRFLTRVCERSRGVIAPIREESLRGAEGDAAISINGHRCKNAGDCFAVARNDVGKKVLAMTLEKRCNTAGDSRPNGQE